MRITVAQTFKHGHDTYTAGDERTVSDEDAAYFKAHGWAVPKGEAGGALAPGDQPPVTLEVQSLTTAQGVQNG